MSREFEQLRERVLGGGIGRTHAARYIAELRDHVEDLLAEEREAGRPPKEALARAMQRLGDVDALAEAMIARRELQAWSARAPVAAFVVAPLVMLGLVIALWIAALAALCVAARHAGWAPSDLARWTGRVASGAARLSNTSLPVLMGWILAGTAVRQRAPAGWPMLGLVVLAAVGAAVQVSVTVPFAGAPGELSLSTGLAGYWGRFALDLAATTAPYGLVSVWRGAHGSGREA
ncbi:permease prefix domain 1-containing protein [Phenylobacterium sp.]|uniref:permease prefix domain 1-containing protein n=1 Tax=Phenylobacterium sp. TaxID=1871053 RepID=UPI001210D4DA|nr:permease prefix domain 1-containing protein [Phenylobacterium sp.]THD56238.1 MAG: hypothetical protein E8A12_14865 [Phenylobacterium sp.]